ncbi:MAG: ABC transporter ATP-binding protein [Oligosphaeraceae bacterium]|nr:ABC transporter ATP-binding protein [Oligosphaeraceae bacterium]
MSHKHHHSQQPQQGLFTIYSRLLKTFARPYWFKICLGALAGAIIGGAMGAGLRVMDMSMNAFESGITSGAAEQPSAIIELPKLSRNRQPVAIETAGEAVSEISPAVSQNQRDTAKIQQKRVRLLHRINSLFERFGLDVSIEAEQSLTLPIVVLIICILFLFFVIQSLGELLNRYCLRWVGSRIVTDMRQRLFDKLQQQSLSYFSRHDCGQLISRCFNDTNAVERVISSSIPELFTAPIFICVAGQFIIAKTREAQLQTPALLVLLFLPFCIIPVYLLSNYLKRYEKRVLERVSTVTSRMLESFSGIQVVKAFNQEKYEQQRFRAVNEKHFKSVRKAILADVFIHPSMQLSAIALASVFVLICYRYQISFGTLAVIGFAAQQAYKPIKDLAKINASLQRSAAAAERIFELLDCDHTLPQPLAPVRISTFQHEIVFEQVSFAYAAAGPVVISDLNLRIGKGQLIAIVGQTGSGKSTLANLLARFYDPTQGSIYLDGRDLRSLAITDLRNLIGIVSQDTFLFNDSIADNIRYGKRDATMQEIQAAAEQANASEFITAAPEGYERKVGERGNQLSGGQKQRLAIARTILKNPPILILDEATSSLDTVTEHLVQEALNNVMHDRTVLAIAHRLSTIIKADVILVMDQGRILEQGSHQELYALNGAYRKLYDMQFSGQSNS